MCRLKLSINTTVTSVVRYPNVVETVFIIHDKYVVARADKAANNIVLIYKNITLIA
jgi:hypothetical protein